MLEIQKIPRQLGNSLIHNGDLGQSINSILKFSRCLVLVPFSDFGADPHSGIGLRSAP
jgi:hypothetical protein